jgi:hypothetical protein
MDFLSRIFHSNVKKESAAVEQRKGYTCWICSSYFESPMDFLEHLKACTASEGK